MSNKVTSIDKQWQIAVEHMTQRLENLPWKKTLSATRSKDLRVTGVEGEPSAFEIEWNDFQHILKRLKEKTPFTADNITALLHNFNHIGKIYLSKDSECYAEFEERKTVIHATIIEKNRLLDKRSKSIARPRPKTQDGPSTTFNDSTGILQHNAKVMVENIAWDITDTAKMQDTSIRDGYVMEKSAIRSLVKMIENDQYFDTMAYNACISFFRGVHAKYKENPTVEAEFAQRQTQLKLAMRFLYEHHDDKNLITTDNLKAKHQRDEHNTMPTHPDNGVPLDQAKAMRSFAYELIGEFAPRQPKKVRLPTSNIIQFKSPKNNEPD